MISMGREWLHRVESGHPRVLRSQKTRVFPVEQRRRQYPETAGLQTVVQSANLSLAV
jgi:hypothetical protein